MRYPARLWILFLVVVGMALGVGTGRADSQILFDGEGIDRSPWGIWIMDPDGTNRSLLYWACDDTAATWSPDRESVAFIESYPYSVYRVDLSSPTYCGNDIEFPDDPDLIRIADPNGGFDVPEDSPLFGERYVGIRPQIQWSPGRDEIALTLETFEASNGTWWGVIALADPSGFNADLVPIYAEPNAVVDYPTWNADGTKLAFVWSPWGDTQTEIIKILDRETGEVTTAASWTPAGVGLSGGRFAWLDWAKIQDPGNMMFAFGSYYPAGEWQIFTVDLAEGSPQAVARAEGRTPSWSPDDEYIVYSYRAKKSDEIRKVHVSSRDITILVSGKTFGDSPEWSRDPVQTTCTSDAQCDDLNECTSDTCIAGSCEHDPLSGDDCGNGGWCEDGVCFEAECGYLDLPICDDLDGCTLDSCVDYRCSFDFDPEIPGCSGGLPGDPCATGADCLSGLCHPKKLVCK